METKKIIKRLNHINHILNALPLISFVFIIQCLILVNLNLPGMEDMPLHLGVTLIFFIGALLIHDNHSIVELSKTHIHFYFHEEFKFAPSEISYRDIIKIQHSDDDLSFGSIIISFQEGSHLRKKAIHFIDDPALTAKEINKNIQELRSQDSYEKDEVQANDTQEDKAA